MNIGLKGFNQITKRFRNTIKYWFFTPFTVDKYWKKLMNIGLKGFNQITKRFRNTNLSAYPKALA